MPRERASGALVVWAWIGALLFAPLGVVLGILIGTRGRPGMGATIVGVSMLSALVALMYYA